MHDTDKKTKKQEDACIMRKEEIYCAPRALLIFRGARLGSSSAQLRSSLLPHQPAPLHVGSRHARDDGSRSVDAFQSSCALLRAWRFVTPLTLEERHNNGEQQ